MTNHVDGGGTAPSRARELVADCAKRGVQGHEAIARRNQARVLAVAAAGLALRDDIGRELAALHEAIPTQDGRIAGEYMKDMRDHLTRFVALYDAAVAQAVAEGG